MTNLSKSQKLENKADLLQSQNKLKKAFECYKQALTLNPNRLELYDKIICVHQMFDKEWTQADFTYNLQLTMKRQEVGDPTFKRINARHELSSKEITQLIKMMLSSKDRETETRYIEEIAQYKEKAIYPLIDFLLGFKEVGQIKRDIREKMEQKKDLGS